MVAAGAWEAPGDTQVTKPGTPTSIERGYESRMDMHSNKKHQCASERPLPDKGKGPGASWGAHSPI